MIRLGSLAGYSFEGPRVLAGWNPPAEPGVYAIMCKTEKGAFAVIYAGHTDDLSAAGFPFNHPKARAWEKRAGNKYQLHVAWFNAPGNGPGHREMLVQELLSVYKPTCNDERYQVAWEDHWIGEDAYGGATGDLTTNRDPNGKGSNSAASNTE